MHSQRHTPASLIAFGGIFAALAIVIMMLGGLIPIATYVSPMLCTILLQIVLTRCGTRIAWAWFGAVAVLGILLSPDKEAAGVFLVIGYYPILKPGMDKMHGVFLWKAAFFNSSVLVLYFFLLKVFGLEGLSEDFADFGQWMLAVMLILGNVTFFMLDHLLGMKKFRGMR